jgi:RNA polymerase primary sigma factor
MAIVSGADRVVRIHIDRGDDVNARDRNGFTPLMLAAASNRAAICQMLLEAGADANLINNIGQDALAVARAKGANDAVLVIGSANTVASVFQKQITQYLSAEFVETISPQEPHAIDLMPLDQAKGRQLKAHVFSSDANQPSDFPVSSLRIDEFTEKFQNHATTENTQLNSNPFVTDSEQFQFENLNWEAEEEPDLTPSEPTLAANSIKSHLLITNHEPVDSSADWNDLDIELPFVSASFLSSKALENEKKIRLLFLRAIREGSVPCNLVKDVVHSAGDTAVAEFEDLIIKTLNDLGAEIDERFEYKSPYEDFEVFVNPDESPDEEDLVSKALAQIDTTSLNRNQPIYIYLKDALRQQRITADEEIALGKEMEASIELALDALAFWPEGINQLIMVAFKANKNNKPIPWSSVDSSYDASDVLNEEISDVRDEYMPEGDAGWVYSPATEVTSSIDSNLEIDSQPPNYKPSNFSESIELITKLNIGTSALDPSWKLVRNALSGITIEIEFLFDLKEIAASKCSEATTLFVQAISAYQFARERMTLANLLLVNSISKKYFFSGIPMDDLNQEGNLGLFKAVEKYDWRRGFKFSTYASWWIRQKISRYVADHGRTIRLPVHVVESLWRLKQESIAYELKFGIQPKLEDLASILQLPKKKVEALKKAEIKIDSIDEIHIDEIVGIEDNHNFTVPDPSKILLDKQTCILVNRLLLTLEKKEEIILRMRFGFGDQEVKTLEEIGQIFNITRERIRQIEAKALRKLRHPSRANVLIEAGLINPQKTIVQQADSSKNVGLSDSAMAFEGDVLSPDNNPNGLVEQKNNVNARNVNPEISISPPATLAELLTIVIALGNSVVYERERHKTKIWVNLIKTTDAPTRSLGSHLVNFGFTFCSQKGYWK